MTQKMSCKRILIVLYPVPRWELGLVKRKVGGARKVYFSASANCLAASGALARSWKVNLSFLVRTPTSQDLFSIRGLFLIGQVRPVHLNLLPNFVSAK